MGFHCVRAVNPHTCLGMGHPGVKSLGSSERETRTAGHRQRCSESRYFSPATAQFYGDFELQKNYAQMRVTGIEKVGDREAYVIRTVPLAAARRGSTSVRRRACSSVPSSGRRRRSVFSPRKPIMRTIARWTGVKLPFLTRTARPNSIFTVKWDEIRHNVPLDDALPTANSSDLGFRTPIFGVRHRCRWCGNIAKPFFQCANSVAKPLSKLGKPPGAEDQQSDPQDDQQVQRLKESFDHGTLLVSSVRATN